MALLIGFDDRLSAEQLSWGHEFLDHNELGLALEMMADWLAERPATISDGEYNDMVRLAAEMSMDDRVPRVLADLSAPLGVQVGALPSERRLNPSLTDALGRDVVLFDIRSITQRSRIQLHLESSDSPWRQGVWLATAGTLMHNGVSSPQLVFWIDTAPEVVEIGVGATDGYLRLYNVWDSGRGLGDFESQSYTSGMLIDEVEPGVVRYRCNDIGLDPTFDNLVFTIRIT